MLQLKEEHLETYNRIDFHETHRDPFDRYLLAAARYEDFAIITKNEKFQLYTYTINRVVAHGIHPPHPHCILHPAYKP